VRGCCWNAAVEAPLCFEALSGEGQTVTREARAVQRTLAAPGGSARQRRWRPPLRARPPAHAGLECMGRTLCYRAPMVEPRCACQLRMMSRMQAVERGARLCTAR